MKLFKQSGGAGAAGAAGTRAGGGGGAGAANGGDVAEPSRPPVLVPIAGGGARRRPSAGAPPARQTDLELLHLVEALRARDRAAQAVLVRRFQPFVERLVAGTLGIDADFSDVVQEVFLRALQGAHRIRDPLALQSWIATLAVFTARSYIRRRRRWRWIRFVAPDKVPEVPVGGHHDEADQAVRATYRVLDQLPADERIAFSLRFVAEMELTEVAAACRVSLATIKRRLARAEQAFLAAAAADPILSDRLARSDRWGSR